jgi:hypothetical protein
MIVAMVVDGEFIPLGGDGRPVVNPKPDTRETPTSEIDQIVAHFARVVCLAQGLPDEDQRRVRDFARACLSTLEATTSLPNSDQKMFDRALAGDTN